MDFIRLIRPVNLIIVLITQLSIYQFFIFSFTSESALNLFLAALLCLSTLIITACGYIINDYYDLEIDKINKPDRLIIDNTVSKKTALTYYSILFLIGFSISIYIAWQTDNFALLPLYPLAQLLLYKYAQLYKKAGLLGNLIVAIMTAFVSAIIIVAERKFLFSESGQKSIAFSMTLSVFSLLLNFVRELAKDIEDIEGDISQGSSSLPIVHGINFTKNFMTAALILCLTFIIKIGDLLTTGFGIIYIIGLIGIFFILYLKIKNAQHKIDYTNLSKYLKITMVGGLLGLLLLSKLTQ